MSFPLGKNWEILKVLKRNFYPIILVRVIQSKKTILEKSDKKLELRNKNMETSSGS